MKKWLVFLLLIITAAATFIPCCREDECCTDQPVSKENNTSKEGVCSPFFSCAACQSFVELARPIQFINVQLTKQLHTEKPQYEKLSGYSCTFWQPPRHC